MRPPRSGSWAQRSSRRVRRSTSSPANISTSIWWVASCADADGRSYGTAERVEHYPASDMLVVDGRLLPMVGAFIRSIDIKKKEIVVHDLPQGLLDGEPLA